MAYSGNYDNEERCAYCGRVIPNESQICILCGGAKPRKQTNYDRIRNMSVEEMAEFMYYASDEICFENCTKDTGNRYFCKFGENVDFSNCKRCMKQWLEREVQGE